MLPPRTHRRTRDGHPPVSRHALGNALILQAGEQISPEARSLAMEVTADSEHDLVILDLPERTPLGMWNAVAEVLTPRRRRGIRLVFCGARQEPTVLAGQWLSDRLNRTVVAPHGRLIRGCAGSLFIAAGPDSGWVRHRPGRSPVWAARRFPRPVWDQALAEPWSTSATGVVDPIPGGAWLHDTRSEPNLAQHREFLSGSVPCQPETITVVLGCPGTPPLSLDDVVRFWRSLDFDSRTRARFVRYGPVAAPAGEASGQVLAEVLDAPVVCYAGVPLASPTWPSMRTVHPDGRLGWNVFARELRYTPRGWHGGPTGRPMVIGHQPPLGSVDALAPLVYWFARDAVIEVVEAGLWMRPPQSPPGAESVRAAALDPRWHLFVFDDANPQQAARMRTLAEDVVARLDPATREVSRLVPASAIATTAAARSGPAAAPPVPPPVPPLVPPPLAPPTVPPIARSVPPPVAAVAGPVTVVSEAPAVSQPTHGAPRPAPAPERTGPPAPAGESGRARLQPVPEPAASALLAGRGLAEERGWLRRSLSREFDRAASSVARVLSQHPGLPSGEARTGEDVLCDAVAVRLYLSAPGATIDAGLRAARKGPHVPFARCVVSGLGRLPSHRGAVVFAASPTPQQWELLRSRRLVTEWGFTNALTAPGTDQDGAVEVLLWSMTARRTRLLEPEEDDRTENRVLFVPGTSFKILSMVDPAPGKRGQLLLRELASDEIATDGRVDVDRVSFDELATVSLRRCVERWSENGQQSRVGTSARSRFGALPGLL